MSQSDSFIDEVTEEVRREKLFANIKKYGWIAVLLVLIVVGGAAWYEYQRSQAEAEAQRYGDALLNALEQGDPAERSTALETVQAGSAEAQVVADFLEAAERANGGDTEAAVALLDAITVNQEVPVIYRSLAQFRALALQSDTLSPADRRSGYEDLAGPGSPLRLMALEQIAITYVEGGNREEAVTRLNALLDEAGATPDLLRRVSQLIVALGAEPGVAPGE